MMRKAFYAAIAASLLIVGGMASLGPTKVLAAIGFTPVRDVTNPALQPFAHSVNVGFSSNPFIDSILVPAGQRLVIETVSADAVLGSGEAVDFTIVAITNGVAVVYFLPVAFSGNFFGADRYSGTQAVRIYADPNSTVQLRAQKNNSSLPGGGTFSISGHFVNLP